MTVQVRTLVIGAGQAGLALSRCLADLGHEHLVLERGRVGERWRSERWDSFRLLSPNWQTRLPGHRYTGPDPEGFMSKEEVVGYFDAYAASFDAPVQSGVTVLAVTPAEVGGGRWTVRTDSGMYAARDVVVATGHFDRPHVPEVAHALLGGVHQVHASRYRNPHELPPGAVLVVGSGPSGQQLARELAVAGRRTFLSVGRHRPLPRRYRGLDVYAWLERMGALNRAADSVPPERRRAPAASPVVAAGRADLDLHTLVADGVEPVGRLQGVAGRHVSFAEDLPTRLAEADEHLERVRARIDAFIEASGGGVPAPPRATPRPAPWAAAAPRRLHLADAGISTVVWATGYRRDLSWVHAPAFDGAGEPIHHRGTTPAPGLHFLGLPWLHRRSSHTIDGVGHDARHLAGVVDAGGLADGAHRCSA